MPYLKTMRSLVQCRFRFHYTICAFAFASFFCGRTFSHFPFVVRSTLCWVAFPFLVLPINSFVRIFLASCFSGSAFYLTWIWAKHSLEITLHCVCVCEGVWRCVCLMCCMWFYSFVRSKRNFNSISFGSPKGNKKIGKNIEKINLFAGKIN